MGSLEHLLLLRRTEHSGASPKGSAAAAVPAVDQIGMAALAQRLETAQKWNPVERRLVGADETLTVFIAQMATVMPQTVAAPGCPKVEVLPRSPPPS